VLARVFIRVKFAAIALEINQTIYKTMRTTPSKFHYETPTVDILPVRTEQNIMSGGTLDPWEEEEID